MVRKAATTNIKTKSKSQTYKKKAEEGPARGAPTKPFFLLVRKGVPKKYRTALQTTFQKMDWSKLNWFGTNGGDCTAEYFLACQHPFAGHNWALCTMDPKQVISNVTRLNTLTSGTKVEYWRVSDLPKRLQSKCYWWGGED